MERVLREVMGQGGDDDVNDNDHDNHVNDINQDNDNNHINENNHDNTTHNNATTHNTTTNTPFTENLDWMRVTEEEMRDALEQERDNLREQDADMFASTLSSSSSL